MCYCDPDGLDVHLYTLNVSEEQSLAAATSKQNDCFFLFRGEWQQSAKYDVVCFVFMLVPNHSENFTSTINQSLCKIIVFNQFCLDVD